MFKAKPLKSGAASLGLKLGRGVPKELLSTIEVYAPFAVNDEAQAAAAAEAFQLLDPDVNGDGKISASEKLIYGLLKAASASSSAALRASSVSSMMKSVMPSTSACSRRFSTVASRHDRSTTRFLADPLNPSATSNNRSVASG